MNRTLQNATFAFLRTITRPRIPRIALTLVILNLATAMPVAAQVCDGDFTLVTQAEVDAFSCEDVTGSLTIESREDITNLDGMVALTSVGGILWIESNALTNVDGLAALTSVGGLQLFGNGALTNVDGLAALTSVEGVMSIWVNAALTNVDGFSALTSIGRDLWIFGNTSLTNVDGLAALSSIGARLHIEGNAAMTNVNGLAAITSVQNLIIDDNDALTNIDGLAAITSVREVLAIENNDALENIDGLAALTSVRSLMFITNNRALENIDGLAALDSVEGDLSIVRNPMLENVDGLATLTSIRGLLSILSNAALTNVDGLAALSSIEFWLSIEDNDALTNVDGLAALTSIGGYLTIGDNDALTNVDGLVALTSIGERLRIRNNPALTNVDGLAALTSVGGNLEIVGNTTLAMCTCGLFDLLDSGGVAYSIIIEDNAPGCNSPEEVLEGSCIENAPPIADAGPDLRLECALPEGVMATLDGSASTDPDGDPLTYAWNELGNPLASGATPTIKLGLGVHTITLIVADGNGATDTDTVAVTVKDTTPPELTLADTPLVLWPANHKLHAVELHTFVLASSDVCDASVSTADAVLSTVSSDEREDATGAGDGHTLSDITMGNECQSVQVRAERGGSGNGRVYRLGVAVTDATGNTAEADFAVQVPKSKQRTAAADAPVYAVSCAEDARLRKHAFAEEQPVDGFELTPAYPNPFRVATLIRFAFAEEQQVEAVLYDAMGRRVRTLYQGLAPANQVQELRVDGTGLAAGVYLVRVWGKRSAASRMVTLLQ